MTGVAVVYAHSSCGVDMISTPQDECAKTTATPVTTEHRIPFLFLHRANETQTSRRIEFAYNQALPTKRHPAVVREFVFTGIDSPKRLHKNHVDRAVLEPDCEKAGIGSEMVIDKNDRGFRTL